MELETHLIVASEVHFLNPSELGVVLKPVQDIGKMLNRLIGVSRMRKDRFPARNPGPGSLIPSPGAPVPSPDPLI